MAGKGGYREGAGRKTKADEEKVKAIAKAAIVGKYGSEEAGWLALLDSRDATLVKFVYEHAYGKPKDKHEFTGEEGGPITFKLDGRFKAD
jgi:hypothetical protein